MNIPKRKAVLHNVIGLIEQVHLHRYSKIKAGGKLTQDILMNGGIV